MDGPLVSRIDEKLYLHDGAGQRWRVHDRTFAGYRHHRLAPGDRRATDRVFVNADGTRPLFLLTPDSDRALTAEVLAAQLPRAEYMGRERYAPNSDAPGRPGGWRAHMVSIPNPPPVLRIRERRHPSSSGGGAVRQ